MISKDDTGGECGEWEPPSAEKVREKIVSGNSLYKELIVGIQKISS